MADKPKGQQVKLLITACTHAWTGTNKRGDTSTIYDVQASREDGTPITDKKLKSFEELPIGEVMEFTVTRFDSERYGTSWTLSRKVNAHQRISELATRVDALEKKVAALGPSRLDAQFGAEPPY